MRGSNIRLTQRSRKLRRDETNAERKLWARIRNRSLAGHKFVRQEAIGPFFADFVCREVHLIVEVDGGQHADSKTDQQRSRQLASFGYRVLRFWNNDVLANTEGVLKVITDELRRARAPHPPRG